MLLKQAWSERKVHPVLQAVAARILGDKSAFFECGFLGLQDTLWDASGRHYFAQCHIEGAADFIYGSGQSIYQVTNEKEEKNHLTYAKIYVWTSAMKTCFVMGFFFQDCAINVTAGELSSQFAYGYITAQGRESSDDPSGFVFIRGTVFGNVRPYLGRAYGPYSRVIFQETTMNADVVPQGWDAWKFPGKE